MVIYFYTREVDGVAIAYTGREGWKRSAFFFSVSMIVLGDSCLIYESPLFGWMDGWMNVVDRLIRGTWLA